MRAPKALALLAMVAVAAGQNCPATNLSRCCRDQNAWYTDDGTANGACLCPVRPFKRSSPQGVFCWPACPAAFHTTNTLTWIGSAFGIIGIVGCICAMWVIFGYSKDRRSIRDRILIGIFLSNLLYSIANTAPNNLVGEEPGRRCGHWVIDQEVGEYKTTCALRGLWMWGKYSMVCFELLAVFVSVKGLRTGVTSLSGQQERIAHVACALTGLIAFAVYFGECKANNEFANLTLADDDDDSAAEVMDMQNYNRDQTVLYQRMMTAWFIPTGMCLCLWFYQLRLFRAFDKDWQASALETREQMDRDLWNTSDPYVRDHREKKETLLKLQRESYVEVVAFLEPYMAVFFLFTIPAIVMVTDMCQETSFAFQNDEWYNPMVDQRDVPVSCNIVSEMVLSLRSICMVAVYFWDPNHRRELYDVKTLASRTGSRLSFVGRWVWAKTLCKPPLLSASGRAQFRQGDDLEMTRAVSTYSIFTTSTATSSDRQSLLLDTPDTRRSIALLPVVDDEPPVGDGASSSLPYHRMEDDEGPG